MEVQYRGDFVTLPRFAVHIRWRPGPAQLFVVDQELVQDRRPRQTQFPSRFLNQVRRWLPSNTPPWSAG
jgi:hypothetical protein